VLPSTAQTYGDAYWMTVASTVASVFCNITIIIDLVRTKDLRKYGESLGLRFAFESSR